MCVVHVHTSQCVCLIAREDIEEEHDASSEAASSRAASSPLLAFGE